MTNQSTPWLWALAAVFVSGVSVGTVITTGSGWGNPSPAFRASHPREPDAAERSVSSAKVRNVLPTEPVRRSVPPVNAAHLQVCDGDDCFEGVGESASEILRRLEEGYRAQLARTNVADDDDVAVTVEADPAAALDPVADASAAALGEGPAFRSGEAADSSLEQRFAARVTQETEDEDILPSKDERGTEGEGANPSVRIETLAQQIQQTNQQLVLVQAPTWVAMMGPDPAALAPVVHDQAEDGRTGEAAVVFGGGLRAPFGTVGMGHTTFVPRPLTSASSRSRVHSSTPRSSLGKSPWAPIDMSGQHNPWQSTQLP